MHDDPHTRAGGEMSPAPSAAWAFDDDELAAFDMLGADEFFAMAQRGWESVE